MPMRATTVRFSERAAQMIEAEARAEGISSAQWIREATLAVLWFRMGLEERIETSELADLLRERSQLRSRAPG